MRNVSRIRVARRGAKWAATSIAIAAAGYAGLVGRSWLRYGRPATPRPEEVDVLLDQFMPVCDVVERHAIAIAAPADVVLKAATEMSLTRSTIARAIFRLREIALGAKPDGREQATGLLDHVLSIGWGILAENPGREIVVGAVTRPWQANVVFRAIAPDQFDAFNEPDYVKIVWTLRADPEGRRSVFRTETRAVATDADARTKFRWYWARFSPGIVVIRWMMLAPLKREAERRAQLATS